MESLLEKIFPEYYAARPKSATLKGWDEWDKHAQKMWPITYFIIEIVGEVETFFKRQGRRIRDVKYWFLYRLHPEYKYNVVQTGLKPNYHEYDTRLIEAILYTNKDFVENAKEVIQWNVKEPATKAFQAAYDWYTIERPRLLKSMQEVDDQADKLVPPEVHAKFSLFMDWMNTDGAIEYNKLQIAIRSAEELIRKGNKKAALGVIKYNEYMWY